MNLPSPSKGYDQRNEAEARQSIKAADLQNRKKGVDLELAPSERLILRSPDGTAYAITVADDGTLGTTAV